MLFTSGTEVVLKLGILELLPEIKLGILELLFSFAA